MGSGAQLKPLPWSNINEIEVQFSENVTVAQGGPGLNGRQYDSYSVSGSSPTIPRPSRRRGPCRKRLRADKLLIDLNADGSNPIQDGTGDLLDGEWTNGVSSILRATARPAATSCSASMCCPATWTKTAYVQAYDGLLVCGALGSTPGTGNYTAFKDVNGDGQITTADSTAVKNALGTALPAGNPVAGPFLSLAPFLGTGAADDGDSAASSPAGTTRGPSSPAAGRGRGERRQRSPIRLAGEPAPRCSVGVTGAGGKPSGVTEREVRSISQASSGAVRSEAGRCGAGGDNRMGKDGVIRQMIGTNGVRGYNGVEMPAAFRHSEQAKNPAGLAIGPRFSLRSE